MEIGGYPAFPGNSVYAIEMFTSCGVLDMPPPLG